MSGLDRIENTVLNRLDWLVNMCVKNIRSDKIWMEDNDSNSL